MTKVKVFVYGRQQQQRRRQRQRRRGYITVIVTANETPYTNRKSKTNGQHKNATNNFDYTTIADRLRAVSWSNNFNCFQNKIVHP